MAQLSVADEAPRGIPAALRRLARQVAFALLLATSLALVLTLAAAPPAAANVDHFEFESFDVQYELSRDDEGYARLVVTERIVARFPDFPQNRGIVRFIPDRYRGYPLVTELIEITDLGGTSIPYEASYSDGFLDLALGDDSFVYGRQGYVIRYTQANVVGAFVNTVADEFYWNVNGTDWNQPFDRVTARIVIDPEVAPALTGEAACYRGWEGSTTPCDRLDVGDPDPEGRVVIDVEAAELTSRQTLTFAVAFEPDTFERSLSGGPSRSAPAWIPLVSGLVTAAAPIAVLISFLLRFRLRPDAKGRGIIVPQYSAPREKINIMAAAHLAGRSDAAIAAQLVDLAVRGNIRFVDPVETPRWGRKPPFTVQLLTADGVDEFEQDILRSLFGGILRPREIAAISKRDTSMARKLLAASGKANTALVDSGHIGKPRGVGWNFLLTLAIGGLIFLTGAVNELAASRYGAPLATATPSFLIVIASLIVSFFGLGGTHPKTEKGAQTLEYLQGMRDYLKLAERDRLRYLQAPDTAERIDIGSDRQMLKLYERLLPWAVLWGVEEQWARELAVRAERLDERPGWYASGSNFGPTSLTSTLASLTSTSSARALAPPGSSSGGSGGGGGAGGGGGGGGGGGR